MGDARHDRIFEQVRESKDRVAAIKRLTDDEVIAALGGARDVDPVLANVLATEAQNRARHASAIAASVGEGVIVLDEAGLVSLVNPAASRILGWTSDDLIGKELHPMLHPFCPSPEDCHLGEVPGLESFFQDEDAVVMRQDGRTIRVAYAATPMTRDGAQGGVLVVRETTDRRRLEESARARQDQLEQILHAIAEGVLTMDGVGCIDFVNAAAERILGRSGRDIKGRPYYDPVWEFTRPDGSVHPVMELPFARALRSGEAVHNVLLGVRRANGSRAIVRTNVVPLQDPTRAQTSILVSFLDVTRESPAEGSDGTRPPVGRR